MIDHLSNLVCNSIHSHFAGQKAIRELPLGRKAYKVKWCFHHYCANLLLLEGEINMSIYSQYQRFLHSILHQFKFKEMFLGKQFLQWYFSKYLNIFPFYVQRDDQSLSLHRHFLDSFSPGRLEIICQCSDSLTKYTLVHGMKLNQNELNQSVSIHGAACRALGSINKLSCTEGCSNSFRVTIALECRNISWISMKLPQAFLSYSGHNHIIWISI